MDNKYEYDDSFEEDVYNELVKYPEIKHKVTLTESGNIEINFNEYLRVVAEYDYQLIYYGDKKETHIHIEDKGDLIKWLLDIAKGKEIFIEDKRKFSLKKLFGGDLEIISLGKFNQKKNRYIKNHNLRIFTGNKIIKE